MSSKYRALIWEQNVVAAKAAGMCLLMGLLVQVTMLGTRDFDMAAGMVTLTAIGTAIVLLLRQDIEGHLASTFERRLARLPLGTFGLVTIPLVTRLLYLSVVCVVLALANHLLHGEGLTANNVLLPLECYLIAQAYTWSRRSITGGEYLIPLTLVAALLFLITTGIARKGLLDAVEILTTVVLPSAFVVIAAGCYGLAMLGVHLERRDARVGLPTVPEIWEWAVTRRAAPAKTFDAALTAQLWYERKRTFWLLPAFTVLTFLLLAFVAPAFPDLRENRDGLAQYLPYVALSLGAALTGAFSMRWRSGYAANRPIDSKMLAQVQFLVTAESLLTTLAGAAICSILGLFLFGNLGVHLLLVPDVESSRNLLLTSYANEEVGLLEMAGILLGPALIFAPIAWALLLSRQLLLVLTVVGGTGTLLAVLFSVAQESSDEAMGFFYWPLTLALLLPPLLHYRTAWDTRCVGRTTVVVLALIHIALAFALFMLGANTADPELALLFAVALAGLVVDPFLSLPLEIARHRAQ
ncbi:MAG: hypothetical protein HYV26_02905 [Candidatus Hydrogenedentes bacterium]|nr:hypothetical protein [Candidatus Hydrogenedentota bacterium]